MDPECVFRPSSADEVAQAVQIMQDTQTQFAVRGGGHMAIKVCSITSSNTGRCTEC
jgi:FAD/FMN-containing dehydrogenase